MNLQAFRNFLRDADAMRDGSDQNVFRITARVGEWRELLGEINVAVTGKFVDSVGKVVDSSGRSSVHDPETMSREEAILLWQLAANVATLAPAIRLTPRDPLFLHETARAVADGLGKLAQCPGVTKVTPPKQQDYFETPPFPPNASRGGAPPPPPPAPPATPPSGEGGGRTLANLMIERQHTLATLRNLCAEDGDLAWDGHLHLADIVEKHLHRPMARELAALRKLARAVTRLSAAAQVRGWASVSTEANEATQAIREWEETCRELLAKRADLENKTERRTS